MKVLIVKEDGLIYAAEVPEEPTMGICSSEPIPNCYEQPNCLCAKEWKPYRAALASAKESAIPVSDQEKVIRVLLNAHGVKAMSSFDPIKPKPGIYPIPGLQWKVDLTHLVAILKESTPSDFKKFSMMKEEPRSVASDRTELSSTDHIADVGKMVGKTAPSTEQESQEVSYNEYLEAVGADDNNTYARKIYERLIHNGFTITRKS